MSGTRTDLVADIIDDMERNASSDNSKVLRAISGAIGFYQPKRFYFNESRSVTFNTVASTDTYSWTTIGTEFYRIDGAYITSGSVIELYARDYIDFETPNTSTGLPSDYAYVASALRLWPNPDGIYAVRLDGHVKLAEPTADGDTGNLWMTEAYELIKCRAKAYLYAHTWFDPEQAQVMRLAERDAYSALRDATNDKTSTGTLAPDSM